MSGQLLTLFKYVFLAVLYLFFLRVLRAVWVELREPKAVAVTPPSPQAAVAQEAPLPAPVSAPGRRSAGGERLQIAEPARFRGQTFDLGAELTVGRAPGCGVALPDDTFVSQLHARVFRRDGDLFVEDLGSTNGTFLNHHKVVAPALLGRGDKLQVGKTVLEVTR